jgi:autotransporter translocation and assembly factor TamB
VRRHPFLIFLAVVGALIASVVIFIQSERFARVVKRAMARYVPSDLGVQADFAGLGVRLFPPGISVREPVVTVNVGNRLGLPENSRLKAERIDLIFLPFQMLTGEIRIHRVVVVNGDVSANFDRRFLSRKKPAQRPVTLAVRWEDLVQVQAESIELQDTHLDVSFADPEASADLMAHLLTLSQWSGRGGIGFEIAADLTAVNLGLPPSLRLKLPGKLDSLTLNGRANANGVQVSALGARMAGIELNASGTVKGNLMSPQAQLPADFQLGVQADLMQAATLLGQLGQGKLKTSTLPSGKAALQARVQGSLERLLETARAQLTIAVEKPRYGSWEADQLEAEGSWAASREGGEVTLAKARITAAARARSGSTQSGRGGSIEIGQFKMNLGAAEPVAVPLKLKDAHIHWLTGPEAPKVHGLDFRVSGEVDALLTPPTHEHGWDLLSKLKLSVAHLRLDNQKLGQPRPMKAILDVKPDVRIEGAVRVDSSGVHVQPGTFLALPRTRFALGGKIDFEKGLDLTAEGGGDLADVGQIAENDIRGKAELLTHVHGPGSAVVIDFEGQIKDAYYLRLRLGDLQRGRITWDDDPSLLIFRGVEVRKGSTEYRVDGQMDLGKVERADLKVQIPSGQVQEFGDIFEELTSDLWWYPRQLSGPMHGRLTVGGGIDLSRLEVAADIAGSNWDYLGEKIASANLTGGYDRGRYHISSLRAVKRTGSLVGRISFDADRRFDWDFRTEGMTAADIDHVARLDVPVRARFGLVSRGKGREGAIESSTSAAIGDVSVRGAPLPSSELTIRSQAGVLVAKGYALGGQATLDASYDFKPGGGSYLKAEARRLDYSPMLLLLNPRSMQDRALAGTLSGSADLTFRTGEFERATGKIELAEYVLARNGTRFQLMEPVSSRVDRGTFDLEGITVRGREGELKLDLRARDARLDGSLTGSLDVSLAEFFSSAIARASGVAEVNVGIGGTVKQPVFIGRAQLRSAQLKVESLESPFENITGTIDLRQNVIQARGIEADLASGRFSASGSITLFADRYPRLALSGSLSGNKVRVYPFQYAKVRGRINVHGDEIPYLVDGSLIVDSALSREKVLNQAQARGLKSARYMPSPTFRQEGDYPRFKLNLDVTADQGILVQNDLFDAELKGKLTLVNTLEAPRVLGTADVIQGKMTFKDRVFQIQSAHVEFDNPAVLNPRFNLTASTELAGTKVQIYSAGRIPDKYKIDLTSTPPLPESEILSLLALGLTSGEMKRLRAGDRGLFEQGEAASLVLHSLDFNRDVQDKTGLQIDLDEAVNTQTGQSIFRPRTDSESAASPKIVIRRQLGKKVDVSVGTTVGVGQNNQTEVNAEVKVTPGFSVIGVYDTLQGVDAREIKSYGVDFKLQRRFK